MKAAKFFILSVVIISLASCGSIRVGSDYEVGTDFQPYKTYRIVQPEASFPAGVSPVHQQRIETAIKAKLTDYDYFYADQKPDLLVSYFVKINTEQAYDT